MLSALLDRVERNDVNYALRSRIYSGPAHTVISRACGYAHSQQIPKNVTTPAARRKRKPAETEFERGEEISAVPDIQPKRKAADLDTGEENTSKKTKVALPDERTEAEIILELAKQYPSIAYPRLKKDRGKGRFKNPPMGGGGVAGLLQHRQGVIYQPETPVRRGVDIKERMLQMLEVEKAEKQHIVPLAPRLSDCFVKPGSSTLDKTCLSDGLPHDVRLSERFSAAGPAGSAHAAAQGPKPATLDSIATRSNLVNRNGDIDTYEPAKPEHFTAATSSDIRALMDKRSSEPGLARLPNVHYKRLPGTDTKYLPCTLQWELNLRETQAMSKDDEATINAALEPWCRNTSVSSSAASCRRPAGPPVEASEVEQHIEKVEAGGLRPAIVDSMKSKFARHTEKCHTETHEIQDDQIKTGTPLGAIHKAVDVTGNHRRDIPARSAHQPQQANATHKSEISGAVIQTSPMRKRKRNSVMESSSDNGSGGASNQKKRVRT